MSFDGRAIVEPVEYGEVAGDSQHGPYGKDTTWGAGTTEVLTGAKFPWKMYYTGLKIHNLDTEANKGRERLFDLAAIKLRNAVQILRKDLITDFYKKTDDAGDTELAVKLTTVGSGSAKAVQTITVTGTALGAAEDPAAANVLVYEVAGAQEAVSVNIAAGDTNAEIATAIAAAIHAHDDWTATATDNVVTMTAATNNALQNGLTDPVLLRAAINAAKAAGSLSMIGLRALCASNLTVGEIAQGSYDWWQGNINTATADRDLTWLLMNQMYNITKKYGANDAPTLIVGSEGVLEQYENSLTKIESGTPSPLIQVVAQAGAPKIVDGGFAALYFKRIPMIADPFCPANKLFFINERYVHWRVLKSFVSTGWEQLRSQGKDWAQTTIFGYGALTTSCNRKFGEIDRLNEA